jgi:hypothetical protein
MATNQLMALLARAREDGQFYQRLQSDPVVAPAGADLTQDELLALQERDRGALVALGVPTEWADWWSVQH